jgi:hypothetical protein
MENAEEFNVRLVWFSNQTIAQFGAAELRDRQLRLARRSEYQRAGRESKRGA